MKKETKDELIRNETDNYRYEIRDEFHKLSFHLAKRFYTVVILLVTITFVTIFNLYVNLERGKFSQRLNQQTNDVHQLVDDRYKVWIQGQNLEHGYLRHVIEIFDRLGFKRVNGTEQWDVLWAHEYPFSKSFFTSLEPHQRVNHFPGSGYITNKVSLATSGLKHIPRAFHLPQSKNEFLEYAKKSPDILWVQKSNDHRGIKVEKLNEIDLHKPKTFIQEYIDKPFLIDGKKFDIGLYVVMTSVNPLRVYLYDDVLLRFCALPYYPFDEKKLDSYVVGDDYTPIWEMPSLKRSFTNMKMNMKQTLNAYIRTLNKDPNKVWQQIEESIISVYENKEQLIFQLSSMFNSTRHFFELVRFDFMLDEELNVYLMEANMSPNLSSLHFKQNQPLYESVIFNTLSLIGLTQINEHRTRANFKSLAWSMKVNDHQVIYDDDLCLSERCYLSCKHDECSICYYCLTDEFKNVLKDAFLEQNSKWSTKRLIPQVNYQHNFSNATFNNNHLQLQWFANKCKQDLAWC